MNDEQFERLIGVLKSIGSELSWISTCAVILVLFKACE